MLFLYKKIAGLPIEPAGLILAQVIVTGKDSNKQRALLCKCTNADNQLYFSPPGLRVGAAGGGEERKTKQEIQSSMPATHNWKIEV
ncbi:MAG: hypothetical protein K8R77_03295 [Anaerolineaceae bacterium]|nr:hypothetical protein [Anaerolineaceae bacterium]